MDTKQEDKDRSHQCSPTDPSQTHERTNHEAGNRIERVDHWSRHCSAEGFATPLWRTVLRIFDILIFPFELREQGEWAALQNFSWA